MFKTDPQQCLQPSYGGKSPAETAQANLTQALASGDKQAIGQGLDQVFGNQFQAGRLGYLDPLGGQITDASLHPSTPFVPTPTGSAAMPVISTTGQYPDGSLTSQPCAAPTTGGFDHPDNDDLHAIAPSKVMDHLGNLGVAQAGLNHPAIQANLRSAAQNPDQENLDWAHAYTALGLSKPTMGGDLKEVTNANGSKDWVYLPRTASGYGTPVQVTHSGQTGKPGAGRATTSAQIFEQGIQAAIQNGDLSPEEGNQLRIQQGLHLGADALPWPDEQKLTGEDAAAKVHLAKTGAHQATGGIGIRAPAVAQVPGSGTPQNAGPPIVDAPQDPNKRQQGMTYNTPKGKLIWLGGGKWGVPGGATGSQ